MATYRLRDALRVPSLISLLRLPLAALFVLSVLSAHEPEWAFVVLCVAGLSDVLDGWLARRSGEVTTTGAVIDALADKTFVLAVVVALALAGHLPPWAVLLLGARDIGELPLLLWLAFSPSGRRRRAGGPRADRPGKLTTVLQYVTITAALFRWPLVVPLCVVTAVAGALAAAWYWRRHLRSTPMEQGPIGSPDPRAMTRFEP